MPVRGHHDGDGLGGTRLRLLERVVLRGFLDLKQLLPLGFQHLDGFESMLVLLVHAALFRFRLDKLGIQCQFFFWGKGLFSDWGNLPARAKDMHTLSQCVKGNLYTLLAKFRVEFFVGEPGLLFEPRNDELLDVKGLHGFLR